MRRIRPHLSALVICGALQLVSGSAAAAPGLKPVSKPHRSYSYSKYYDGAFVEYGVRGGLTAAPVAGLSGWTFDAGLRQSFPMLVGDFRLSYRFDNLRSSHLDGPRAAVNTLNFALAVHPLYLVLLGNDWLSYTIASLYGEIGIGGQYASYYANATKSAHHGSASIVWSLGAGFDVPLWSPDVGYAPWVNVLYRYHASWMGAGDGKTLWLGEHTIFVGLGWRINGLLY